ncbi:hypothetical protein [Aestuariivivens insulae]|uniref:hypothetical protein n=1 Tax=Aestuariivivens insulae TaxID=1621988 RepID=UPI001F5951BC|nr:hypothetical protein [Aestuariivivens insulae]
MKNPLLKNPVFFNVVILIISGIISAFTLIFGVAHLFEGVRQIIKGNGHEIPLTESILGWVIVLMLCVVGIISLLLAVAAIQAIFKRNKT